MTKKWWQRSSKGEPIAIATAVPDPSPPPSPADVPSGDYYAAGHYENTRDARLHHIQAMGDRSGAHKLFLMFNVMAGLTGVNNAFAQCLALRYDGNKLSDVILRCYLIGFCALVVLIEMEMTPVVRNSFVLSNWVCRGIFYTFLGALGHNLYDVGYDNRYRAISYYNNGNGYRNGNGNGYRNRDYNGYYGTRIPSTEDFEDWYIWLTSRVMFLIGCVYILMGALCLQQKLAQWREQYQQRNQTGDGLVIRGL